MTIKVLLEKYKGNSLTDIIALSDGHICEIYMKSKLISVSMMLSFNIIATFRYIYLNLATCLTVLIILVIDNVNS